MERRLRSADNAEFAHAPDGWKLFKEDGLFIVGESDARKDWPYVHPGPVDAWAGSTQHTYALRVGAGCPSKSRRSITRCTSTAKPRPGSSAFHHQPFCMAPGAEGA